jgi:hypothetical protein
MKNNELIAEFMGAIPCVTNTDYLVVPGKGLWYPADLKYDTDWDWLMPVIEKIESETLFQVTIHTGYSNISGELDNGLKYNQDSCFERQEDTKLDVTYRSVVSFIKWLNQNK